MAPGMSGVVDSVLGTVLEGRYRIVEHVGRGSMGSVYRARQLSVDRNVAIKLIRSDLATDGQFVRRFEHEAHIISKLHHPNSLRLIDFGRTQDGRLYIVTDFLVGTSLSERLGQGTLTALHTLRIVRQMAEALFEAHELGILHRDLKPANVFLHRIAERDVVKILDFGIAKLGERSVGTSTGRIWGSPGYMSPEQAKDEDLDPRTDLYALGVVAYRCLAGRPPFEAKTPVGLLMKHVNDPAPPLSLLRPGLDPELAALVMGLLEKDRNRRPKDAAEVRDRVEAIERRLATAPEREMGSSVLQNDTLDATAPYPPATSGSRVLAGFRPSRLRTALFLASLLAIGGALAWSIFRARPKETESALLSPPVTVRPQGPALSPPPQAPRVDSKRRQSETRRQQGRPTRRTKASPTKRRRSRPMRAGQKPVPAQSRRPKPPSGFVPVLSK